MTELDLPQIQTPTLVLDENKARRNLKRMAEKAAAQHIRFRPHFKTHQSAQVGEWFRDQGVEAITVSSLSMAQYFADHGWQDILVAFPVNLRELETINRLAGQVHLALLLESLDVAERLDNGLKSPVDAWIKVDTGLHRTGVGVGDVQKVSSLARAMQDLEKLKLHGLLTHAGQTYHAASTQEINDLYAQSCGSLRDLNSELEKSGITGLELSVGDTPGCWLSADLGQVDEIRPGNFIFFDSMMMDFGVCSAEDIAVAVACPVVSLHAEREEVVIYGGAVHLSKEAIEKDRRYIYGYVAFLGENGWDFAGRENYVKALSQEHGVVHLKKVYMEKLKVGDLLYILPVHSCLAVDALGEYLELQGKQRIATMLTC